MTINTDGQKKQGRILKKNNKILSSVSLVDFSFEQISSANLVSFDNPDRTIIHSRYHDPGQLNEVVKSHDGMDETVQDSHHPRLGVIFPADFTQDWHNERLNSKRRAMGIEDDEEVDVLEEARSRAQSSKRWGDGYKSKNGGSDSDSGSDLDLASPEEQEQDFSPNDPFINAQASSPEAIRAPETDGKVKSLNEGDMSSAINKAFSHKQAAEQNNQTRGESDSFEPLPTEDSNDSRAVEDRAIESWKSKQQIAKQNEQALEELKSLARSEGYQAGFREGEEKGLLAGQKTAAQVFSKVTEILNEFSGLKELILENVQKNFYELSQAIGEALLGREFSIKPEAYATMIQRVIKDTIAPNEFKVRMHPDTWQKVHDLALQDLNPFLIKDNTIALGDFRVESNLTVVDVSAKKMVSQLLEKTDINLFDDKKVS
jgi:flagellar biosynthesis/type III secretory pathway protein FliH